MQFARLAEKRFSDRIQLTGLLPGKLCITTSQAIVNARPIDLSQHGLGIVSAAILKPGVRLQLITPTTTIELEVIWGKADFGKRNLHRYGLVAIDPTVNLIELFTKCSCIKQN